MNVAKLNCCDRTGGGRWEGGGAGAEISLRLILRHFQFYFKMAKYYQNLIRFIIR